MVVVCNFVEIVFVQVKVTEIQKPPSANLKQRSLNQRF